MTWPECQWHPVCILFTSDVKTKLSLISDVSSCSFVEIDQHISIWNVWSNDCTLALNKCCTKEVSEYVAPFVLWSDCFGPCIIEPPLFLVLRVRIADSQSVLFCNNVFVIDQSSVFVHSSLNLEKPVFFECFEMVAF
jgi:hypothetical protein